MTQRIKQKDLDLQVERLNDLTNNKLGYTLGYAYGGIRLERKHNDSYGAIDVLPRTTKKEQYYLIVAYIHGIEIAQELANI